MPSTNCQRAGKRPGPSVATTGRDLSPAPASGGANDQNESYNHTKETQWSVVSRGSERVAASCPARDKRQSKALGDAHSSARSTCSFRLTKDPARATRSLLRSPVCRLTNGFCTLGPRSATAAERRLPPLGLASEPLGLQDPFHFARLFLLPFHGNRA
jgi:hypothetical protein